MVHPIICRGGFRWRCALIDRGGHNRLVPGEPARHRARSDGRQRGIRGSFFRNEAASDSGPGPSGRELLQPQHAQRQPVRRALVVPQRIQGQPGCGPIGPTVLRGHQLPGQHMVERGARGRFQHGRGRVPGLRVRCDRSDRSGRRERAGRAGVSSPGLRGGDNVGGLESVTAGQEHGSVEGRVPEIQRSGGDS